MIKTNLDYIKTYLSQYLVKLNPNIKITNKTLIKCPLNCNEQDSALILNNRLMCNSPNCKFDGNIFDLARINNSLTALSDEEVADYLIHILNIDINDNIDNLLKKYYEAGFYLFPLANSTKVPIAGIEWKKEAVKNIEVWKGWIARGYGLALKLGIDSGVIAIDIDSDETRKKILPLFNKTLTQTTTRGEHYLYFYDDSFNHINHANLRSKGYEMEIRANNSYIVIAPTSVEGEKRTWSKDKISCVSTELKDFLLGLIDKKESVLSEDDKIQQAINNNDLGTSKLSGLNGQCNDTFVKLGGCLRKKLNIEQTEYSLSLFNNLLEKPMNYREIKSMISQLNKYHCYDKEELAKTILDRLDIIKDSSAFQLSKTLNLSQKDIEDVLNYLEKEEKIIGIGQNRYRRLKAVEWADDLTDESTPINFEMPYFGKYAYLNWSEIIIIGSQSGTGKTIIAANIMKQLIEQKRTPYLISTESTSTIGKTFHKLGVQPKTYKYKVLKSALDVELPDNSICIIDWLTVKDGEFAKIASIYEHLYDQAKKHKSFLIVFEQLRLDSKDFFAKNLNLFYCSLAASYHYGDNGRDHLNTYFKTHKIRDSKNGLSYLTIPTIYNSETREVKLRE